MDLMVVECELLDIVAQKGRMILVVSHAAWEASSWEEVIACLWKEPTAVDAAFRALPCSLLLELAGLA
jgi:hypothetical protein